MERGATRQESLSNPACFRVMAGHWWMTPLIRFSIPTTSPFREESKVRGHGLRLVLRGTGRIGISLDMATAIGRRWLTMSALPGAFLCRRGLLFLRGGRGIGPIAIRN